MTFDVYTYLCLFFVYSFFGWCAEVAFQALTFSRLENRGFLNGPLCPIYGVSCLCILFLLQPVMDSAWALFFFGMLIISAIELAAGWALDRLFHMRWWDYTNEPFNVHGYICLRFSLMWGVAAVLVGKIVHPAILGAVQLMPKGAGWVICGILLAGLAADLTVTLIKVLGLRRQIKELEAITSAIRKGSDGLSNRIGTATLTAKEKSAVVIEKAEEAKQELNEKVTETRQELSEKVTETRQDILQRVTETQQELNQRLSQYRQEQERHRLEMDGLREQLDELDAQIQELDSRRSALVQQMKKSRAAFRRELLPGKK